MFLKFWEKEAPAMRKVIERIPEGSDYRPDGSRGPRGYRVADRPRGNRPGRRAGAGVSRLDRHPGSCHDERGPGGVRSGSAAATTKMQSLPLEGWTRQVPFKYQGKEFSRSTGFEHAWGFSSISFIIGAS